VTRKSDDEFDQLGEPAFEDENRPPTRSESREVERRNIKSRDTAKAAAQLALSGYQDWEIAELLEYSSPGTARAAYERVWAEAGDLEADIPAMRNRVSHQYDAVLKSLSGKALNTRIRRKNPETGAMETVENKDHLAYAAAFVRVLDRKAVLHGLNAPQVLQISDPDAKQFNDVIAMVLRKEGLEAAEEGDIWDAEIVEDDDAAEG
jgi:hypothetical protein